MGLDESSCSGPDCPPGFENVIGLGEASSRAQMEEKPVESDVFKDSLDEKSVSDQRVVELVDKVPQTPLIVSDSKLYLGHGEDNGV